MIPQKSPFFKKSPASLRWAIFEKSGGSIYTPFARFRQTPQKVLQRHPLLVPTPETRSLLAKKGFKKRPKVSLLSLLLDTS